MRIGCQSKNSWCISHYFIFSLLGTYISLVSSHAMEEQEITSNPNDIIILIEEVSSLKNQVTTIDSTQKQLQKNVEAHNSRITTLEKFMNGYSNKAQTIAKSIPADNILKISLAGGILATASYLYNPTLASPFIGLYFTTAIYQAIKLFRDYGTAPNTLPL